MAAPTARRQVAITPSDTVNIQKNAAGEWPSAIRCGTGGTVVLVDPDDVTCTHVNVANGETIPCAAKRINATNTTAQNIIGFYL